MAEQSGKVKSMNTDLQFGWIEFEPESEEEDDQLQFELIANSGIAVGSEVTFTKVLDPNKSGKFKATAVSAKK
ncbi:hypothetical protein [Pseudomonas sichuanensis]|uniref:hypothetical protein n=1 Tax=Pseudomonas sichuanensis TaxID=2213015 RepID=UPI00215FFAE9|nr:hypothetical protein [Pseudomonas sichuanensis]UVL88509.1 hypothetical protein LOY51_22525 [Pseudomonas sichuanensis]